MKSLLRMLVFIRIGSVMFGVGVKVTRAVYGSGALCGKARLAESPDFGVAEREGFEPSIRFNPYDALAKRCFRPLSHLSKFEWRAVNVRGGCASKNFQRDWEISCVRQSQSRQ